MCMFFLILFFKISVLIYGPSKGAKSVRPPARLYVQNIPTQQTDRLNDIVK